MKIIFISMALIFTMSSQLANSKNPPAQIVQLSFISTQKDLNAEPDQSTIYCIKTIKQFAAIQKKRRLTFEEMMLVMKVMIFLFTTENDDESKHIEIILNNKETIKLPYSSYLFDCINQLVQDNEDDEDDQEEEHA